MGASSYSEKVLQAHWVHALSVQSWCHVWKCVPRFEGFASSTVILWFLSCFLLCQEESKVDSAFQTVLQHPCCGKLRQKMSVDNLGWFIRVWKELPVAVHVQGVSWRKQEERGWCGSRGFEQGLLYLCVGKEKVKIIF